MKVNIGFSSCPNDTFIFDAILHGKIDTEGLEFEAVIADVEELNRRAFRGELDITKLSYHAYAHLSDNYILLDAGSALGNNCGPLLIAKKVIPAEEIPQCRIAIPGRYTTANFLLGLAHPAAQNKVEILFSDIETALLDERVDAGLIIHENRFTYQNKGLMKLIDLGEFWEAHTGHPIPLGGIAIRRDLPKEVQQSVNRVLRQSVIFAMNHPADTYDFVRRHAQEMDREVMYQHIDLYVNDFTRDLGLQGRQAVLKLFEMAERRNLIPGISKPVFLGRDEKIFPQG
jgi:1,4-dihydroxy-6-naphthoate synthase